VPALVPQTEQMAGCDPQSRIGRAHHALDNQQRVQSPQQRDIAMVAFVYGGPGSICPLRWEWKLCTAAVVAAEACGRGGGAKMACLFPIRLRPCSETPHPQQTVTKKRV
jgi:hypothetical protein